ncbi:MAG: BolA family transcriptional regulator [Deltaproteobacteria bacterium]|jgi:BolA protein|nr:BolA family transcriptional regulator [Deltaproteobacteria bacterium]
MTGEVSLRDALETRLRERLEATHVEVVDESHLHAGHAGARDGGGHFRAVIVSREFEGLGRVRAQQLVYGVVDDWMGKQIHALSLKTFTPEAWADSGTGSPDS